MLALVASGFEMVGAILVFVLVGLAADPTAGIDLPIIGDVRSMAGGLDNRTLLLRTAAAIALFFIVRGVIQIWTMYYQRRVAEEAGARVSASLVEGYLRSPYPFHLRRDSAELIRNSFQSVLQLVNQVFMPMITVAAQSLLTIGLLIVLVAIAPVASAFVVLSVGGASLLVLLIVQPRLKHHGGVVHRSQHETLTWLQQALLGIRDVKLYAAEQYFTGRYSTSRDRMARAKYISAALQQMPATIIETALIGFILIFLSISVIAGDQSQQALPILGLFAYVGLRLMPSLQRIIRSLNDIKYSSAPVAALHQDMKAVHSLPPISLSTNRLSFADKLVLNNVSYQYEESDQPALNAIHLTIRSGEEIGVCGPTGGGKSTLIDIIIGLLEPTTGQVTVDGINIAGCVREWQNNLGVVSQMIFLIDDTLRNNIALGILADEIDEEALAEAVHLAQLSEFIESLPEGLNTTVGEQGMRISGGQRQRIAIARALYHRPEVIIFDEGTSALDNVVESNLLSSLERLRGSHTILHVAHRLSTVRRADRIIFVEDGHITGEGAYDDLAASHDGFRRMDTIEPPGTSRRHRR